MTDGAAGDAAGGAADLVAVLWCDAPPAAWASPPPADATSRCRECIARIAARADHLAGGGAPAERQAARLLADTARAIDAILRGHDASPDSVLTPHIGTAHVGALASPLRLRLARMQRWLDARAAADDACAAPAADLCLWTLEHLEADGR